MSLFSSSIGRHLNGYKELSKHAEIIDLRAKAGQKVYFPTICSNNTPLNVLVKPGDKVRIISGPFADFDADIIEVYPDKSKLRANVSIFGRETPVELEYKQINKL